MGSQNGRVEVSEFLDFLKHPDPTVREASIRDLYLGDDPNKVEVLQKIYGSEQDLRLKTLVKRMLAKLSGPASIASLDKPPPSMDSLKGAFSSGDLELVKRASLYAVKHGLKECLPTMLELERQTGEPYLKACNLRLLSLNPTVNIQEIARYLGDREERIVSLALNVLSSIEATASRVYVAQLVDHSNPRIAEMSRKILQNCSIEILKNVVKRMETSPYPQYKKTAVRVIELIPEVGQSVSVPDFQQFFLQALDKETDPRVLATLLLAMAGTDGNRATKIAVLKRFSGHKDNRVRANCLDGLGLILPDGERHFFVPFLTDSSSRVVANSILAIWVVEECKYKYQKEVNEAFDDLIKRGNDSIKSALYCLDILQEEAFLPILSDLLCHKNSKIVLEAKEVLITWAADSPVAARVLKKYQETEVPLDQADLSQTEREISQQSQPLLVSTDRVEEAELGASEAQEPDPVSKQKEADRKITHHYPVGPKTVPEGFTTVTSAYRRHAYLAFGSLSFFIFLYFSLTGCFGWISINSLLTVPTGKDGEILDYLMAIPAIFLTIFFLKGLFFVQKGGSGDSYEITAKEQPKFFKFLEKLADEAGAPRPHRVFLSAEINACVYYDITLLNLIFPTKKNLEIGMGLVNVLTVGEMKAVLAHEFGHFTQKSMAVGRWVYIAQQVAYHLIYHRDLMDDFLKKVSNWDIRIAWFGWLMRLVIWALRAIMDTAFTLVTLAQRSLSREMEMHADLVAVSLTGSDSLIHALYKLNSADAAWERSLGIAFAELGREKAVTNLYDLQLSVINKLKEVFDDENFIEPPLSPRSNQAFHRVFKTEIGQPPRMWATHPSNRSREDNAKRIFLAAPLDDRPGWTLFDSPESLRQMHTRKLLSYSELYEQAVPASQQDILEMIRKRYDRWTLNSRYRGAYLGRSIVRQVEYTDQLYNAGSKKPLNEVLGELYPLTLKKDLEKWRSLKEEIGTLEGLRDGYLKAHDGVIRHRGKVINKKDLPMTINHLQSEFRQVEKGIQGHDALCRTAHLKVASHFKNGWQDYLVGLLQLHHYAEHAETNVLDAQGYLANVWNVVIADGNVSTGERKRLIQACNEVHRTIQETYRQIPQVRLCEKVAKRLRVDTWEEIFPEDCGLPRADENNLADWVKVKDGWVS
ncbi:M48 family metalloprotease, partial [bacterium]|nr:M48 family metalloprotease [bacterium]